MSLTLDEVEKLIERAKAAGIMEFEFDNLRIVFRSDAAHAPIRHEAVPEMDAAELMKPFSPLDELSPEEILMFATPRFDEIQAEKAAHQEKLNSRE